MENYCFAPLNNLNSLVEFNWLEHLWNHANMFEIGVVRKRSTVVKLERNINLVVVNFVVCILALKGFE